MLFTALNLASITSPNHIWVFFLFLFLFFCLGSIPSFFLEIFLHWSPVAYWAPTNPGNLSFSVFYFCLFILFMGFSRQEYWSGMPFPSPVDQFCQTSPLWPVCLGWPHTAWLSFIELDTAVVHVIRSASCLWLWFQCVMLLWCSLASLTILIGFPLPWMWGISSWLLQKSEVTAPYLGRGISLHSHPSWPWTWSSSSWPSCARSATTPWRRGCSSRPPPLMSGVVGLKLLT